ncbi:hypothetical protein PF010_g18030 [Phytophthora fragariae]|uniref:DDE Tnp4 domain-containing protein n=1 Tax=Phytophthora fragariae TaxID=53985 RepID=A0A6A3IDS5_9STRA|nr:hypothetical protein PF011_g22434 [Phytophthora fragariae]KAE9091854.1 hypothetical protein PF010_g18030 [Phytophthora fragariae]KAE9188799.1 hypothetical protein PF004_g22393 [Phytophthora fragariae]
MPPSDFKKVKRGVTATIFQLAMTQQLQEANRVGHDGGDAAEDDVLSDLVKLRHALDSARYSVPRKNVVRSTAHQGLLYTLGDAEFRTFTRVSKNTFNVLLDLICDDVVFQPKRNSTKRPQRDVAVQLAVTLEWYAAHRNGNSVSHFVMNYGIGAGTVSTYVRRVQKALLRYYASFVAWPSHQKRIESSAFHEERFGLVEGVVGFVDGTHVILDQKPHINGALHYNRKCRYSFNVQIVCNEDKVILHAFTGWPGSCCDSTVFSKTPLAQHPERFFSSDQYLIGKSHADQPKKDYRHVNNHILACVMLHNIGIALFDEWDDAALDDEDDDDTDINSGPDGKTAKEKRERIKTVLLDR